MGERRVVIGVGNADRGDDGAGRRVASLLSEQAPIGVEIIEHDGEATSLLSSFEGAAEAFLIDACASGAPPGTVRRFDVTAAPLPRREFGGTTHGFGLAAAIELARALGRLPPSCIVYAIEGESFEFGAPLSPSVEAAVAEVARGLKAEIECGEQGQTALSIPRSKVE
ncbi:MAG: hydrogenase maturation protease [Methylocystaceae bacterium]|nr:MAG: hydrogenase maturation protease [Methylocystaceae bacterium]